MEGRCNVFFRWQSFRPFEDVLMDVAIIIEAWTILLCKNQISLNNAPNKTDLYSHLKRTKVFFLTPIFNPLKTFLRILFFEKNLEILSFVRKVNSDPSFS